MPGKKKIIHAELLYDGRTALTDVSIVVQDDRILDVTRKTYQSDVSGVVTPAFIDPHSHIGMERQGEPSGESEVDDFLKPVSPLQNPVDSIYFDDRAFVEAVDFGVLYSCVVPGSGNLIGGRAATIKNFAKNRAGAVMDDYGYKMALGYNPRASREWQGTRHNTRMGNARLLEKTLSEVIRVHEKALIKRDQALFELSLSSKATGFSDSDLAQNKRWIEREYELSLSSEQWALVEMLSGKKTVKVHVHKEDDALFLIDLKKKYALRATAEHASSIRDVEIFRELSRNDIPIVYGPMSSLDYKVELVPASYNNVAALMESGAQFGLMTDHPVVLAHHLRDSLKYFLIRGMTPETAVGLVTLENAKILNLDDRLGSVEKGKIASLIVWDKDPFHLSAFPRMVMAEGRIIREKG